VPVYATFGFGFFERDQLAAAAKLWVSQGFQRLKMTVGNHALASLADTSTQPLRILSPNDASSVGDGNLFLIETSAIDRLDGVVDDLGRYLASIPRHNVERNEWPRLKHRLDRGAGSMVREVADVDARVDPLFPFRRRHVDILPAFTGRRGRERINGTDGIVAR